MTRSCILSMALLFSFLAAGCASTPGSAPIAAPKSSFNVRTLGATGDGKTKDTAAFQKSLDACAFAGGGEVVVPEGNYLIGSIQISSNTTLRVERGATITGSPDQADYPLMDIRWEGRWRTGHRSLIYANHASNIALVGQGTIVGDPQLAFLRNPRGPALVEPIDVTGLRIEDLSFRYGRLWTIHLTYCEDVVARNLNIRTDPSRANGDGIDIDSCRNVLVEKCDIDAGDDAIAIKSGRGMEAVRIGRPSEDIVIIDSKLGSSFAGVGIGTEMSGGVRNVRIERCTFTRIGQNAVFIKSRLGRGGFIDDVSITDSKVTAGAGTFLGIDLLTKGIVDDETVMGENGIPRVTNLRISNIDVNCRSLLVGTLVPPEKPIDGLSFRNITGTCQSGIALSNVVNADLRNISITGYSGNLLTVTNVQGNLPENTAGAATQSAAAP